MKIGHIQMKHNLKSLLCGIFERIILLKMVSLESSQKSNFLFPILQTTKKRELLRSSNQAARRRFESCRTDQSAVSIIHCDSSIVYTLPRMSDFLDLNPFFLFFELFIEEIEIFETKFRECCESLPVVWP